MTVEPVTEGGEEAAVARTGLAVLARSSVGGLLAIAFLSRVTAAVLPITLLVGLAQTYGYGRAGIVNGSGTLVLALLVPLRGRVLDRFGHRRPLLLMAATATTLMSLAAVSVGLRWPWWSPLLFVVAASMTSPPLNAALRSSWRTLVDGQKELKTVHSADSVLEEAGFVVAPLAAGLAILVFGARHAYEVTVGCYVLVVIGYLVMARRWGLSRPATGAAPVPADRRSVRRRWLGPLAEPRMLMILLPLLVMGCVFGGMGVYTPAYTEHVDAVAWLGPLLAAISVGGVVGGIAYGLVPWEADLWHKFRLLVLGFALPACFLFAARSLWLLAALLLCAGLFVTPLFINAFLLVDATVTDDVRNEANTWVGASTDIANGVIAMLVGALVAGQHWQTTRLLLSGCAFAGVLLALLWRGPAQSPQSPGDREQLQESCPQERAGS
ncbi:MFS transporter [Streptomyces sp. CA-249302]|uniref:MFS transporter n=1 Tax=Streptomyces sp. CA-249302 TaxID=3240058 RepID=UPI003D8B8EDD